MRVSNDAPYCPPLVRLGDDGPVAHLLCWELMVHSRSWWAWVSWVLEAGDRPQHKVVQVRADRLRQLEEPGAYGQVPRRVRGQDGVIRPYEAK